MSGISLRGSLSLSTDATWQGCVELPPALW